MGERGRREVGEGEVGEGEGGEGERGEGSRREGGRGREGMGGREVTIQQERCTTVTLGFFNTYKTSASVHA